jgi:hypothetical protein
VARRPPRQRRRAALPRALRRACARRGADGRRRGAQQRSRALAGRAHARRLRQVRDGRVLHLPRGGRRRPGASRPGPVVVPTPGPGREPPGLRQRARRRAGRHPHLRARRVRRGARHGRLRPRGRARLHAGRVHLVQRGAGRGGEPLARPAGRVGADPHDRRGGRGLVPASVSGRRARPLPRLSARNAGAPRRPRGGAQAHAAGGGGVARGRPAQGGQGTINVPCWAPDARRFAFVRYP